LSQYAYGAWEKLREKTEYKEEGLFFPLMSNMRERNSWEKI